MQFLENQFVLIFISFGTFLLCKLLQKRTGLTFLNPILISILILIIFLKATEISYEKFANSGKYIEFWLKPSVVALGVPLYRQLNIIKKQIFPLLLSELIGCIIGILSVIAIAELLGASRDVIVSLAPKAVTTPIAMEISSALGGIPPLTAAVVVCTGIFGGVAGFHMVKLSGLKSPIAEGLSIGTASHAVGTASAMERGERYGAFSSLGLTLNGLFTAALSPLILSILGYA